MFSFSLYVCASILCITWEAEGYSWQVKKLLSHGKIKVLFSQFTRSVLSLTAGSGPCCN